MRIVWGDLSCQDNHIKILFYTMLKVCVFTKKARGKVGRAAAREGRKGKHDVLSVNIDKDDKMLLYTDGVVEINNEEGKQFEIEGIKEAINEGGDCSNRDLAMDIYKAGRNYTKKRIEDDITILEFTFRTSQDKPVNT